MNRKKKKEKPNINDFPADLRMIIYAAIQAGQTDLASELIGNYLKRGENYEENNNKRSLEKTS